MLFAHLKRILKLDRLRLRGPCGARDEFLLAATPQNLRKMAKLMPVGAPPWRHDRPVPPSQPQTDSDENQPSADFFNTIDPLRTLRDLRIALA